MTVTRAAPSLADDLAAAATVLHAATTMHRAEADTPNRPPSLRAAHEHAAATTAALAARLDTWRTILASHAADAATAAATTPPEHPSRDVAALAARLTGTGPQPEPEPEPHPYPATADITAARCATCGYVTTDPAAIDAWNHYGDHDGPTWTVTCSDGHTAWTRTDGTTDLIHPNVAHGTPWRTIPADPADRTYQTRPRGTDPRTITPHVYASPA